MRKHDFDWNYFKLASHWTCTTGSKWTVGKCSYRLIWYGYWLRLLIQGCCSTWTGVRTTHKWMFSKTSRNFPTVQRGHVRHVQVCVCSVRKVCMPCYLRGMVDFGLVMYCRCGFVRVVLATRVATLPFVAWFALKLSRFCKITFLLGILAFVAGCWKLIVIRSDHILGRRAKMVGNQ